MSADARVLLEAARLAESGERFVLITVSATEGSAPRATGAKMIWLESERTIGTIGGGELEQLARDAARSHLSENRCATERFVLGADADQCCGGVVELLFEPYGTGHQIVIFGAGHVSFELARILRDAPVQISVVDDRPDWNSADRFPDCRRIQSFEDGIAETRRNGSATIACVMTCSHDRDLELVRELLSDPPAFVGLIGSRSKRQCFVTRLTAAGLDRSAIDLLHCPIGLGDMGKAPVLVAISTAGQILLELKRLADA